MLWNNWAGFGFKARRVEIVESHGHMTFLVEKRLGTQGLRSNKERKMEGYMQSLKAGARAIYVKEN